MELEETEDHWYKFNGNPLTKQELLREKPSTLFYFVCLIWFGLAWGFLVLYQSPAFASLSLGLTETIKSSFAH
jgi:hypothetical protein